jgi:hypothetical protein
MPSVSNTSADGWTYDVTDVELDGPWPGVNSMLGWFERAA